TPASSAAASSGLIPVDLIASLTRRTKSASWSGVIVFASPVISAAHRLCELYSVNDQQSLHVVLVDQAAARNPEDRHLARHAARLSGWLSPHARARSRPLVQFGGAGGVSTTPHCPARRA